jgi:hypothetical protein
MTFGAFVEAIAFNRPSGIFFFKENHNNQLIATRFIQTTIFQM